MVFLWGHEYGTKCNIGDMSDTIVPIFNGHRILLSCIILLALYPEIMSYC